MNDTTPLLIVHIALALGSIVKVTGLPEAPPVVRIVYVGPPTVVLPGAVELNVTVWLAWPTAIYAASARNGLAASV